MSNASARVEPWLRGHAEAHAALVSLFLLDSVKETVESMFDLQRARAPAAKGVACMQHAGPRGSWSKSRPPLKNNTLSILPQHRISLLRSRHSTLYQGTQIDCLEHRGIPEVTITLQRCLAIPLALPLPPCAQSHRRRHHLTGKSPLLSIIRSDSILKRVPRH